MTVWKRQSVCALTFTDPPPLPAPARRSSVVARHGLAALLCGATIAAAALAVWLPAANQRSLSERSFAQTRALQHMLTALIDQETALRGYALAGKPILLQPYRQGRAEFDAALQDARQASGHDHELDARLREAETVARTWQAEAQQAIAALQANGRRRRVTEALHRKAVMDRYRQVIGQASDLLDRHRRAAQRRAELLPVIAITFLSVLFMLIAYTLILRPRVRAEEAGRRAQRFAEEQQEFTETMQMAGSEEEAHTLLERHLERSIRRAHATVLRHNNSENRLESGNGSVANGDLAGILADTDARSCLAIRYGRPHEEGADARPLLSCRLCGAVGAANTTCMPSLVGGQVIGSVLVSHEEPLDEADRTRVRESITQAGPVLANLRTLAQAERRAATDALTGLANARSVQDTLSRMVAQAARAGTHLTTIMLDLDRFKALNDSYGHDAGNDVLAAVGAVLAGAIRGSDFAGRYGGEEFIVLLPDTDRAGGIAVAEKLRSAIARLNIPGVTRGVTASFGVAAMPEDGMDAVMLVRQADRALYRAKELGRDRVEAAAQKIERAIPPSTATSSPVT
jgi:diguanylate cyclase (GGDEF)-like protein